MAGLTKKGVIHVRLSYEAERLLRRWANDDGVSLSDLVRSVVERERARRIEVVEVKSK